MTSSKGVVVSNNVIKGGITEKVVFMNNMVYMREQFQEEFQMPG